jgi:hypothetical protein
MHAQGHYTFGKGFFIKEDDRIQFFINTENSVDGMIITCSGYNGHKLISSASHH